MIDLFYSNIRRYSNIVRSFLDFMEQKENSECYGTDDEKMYIDKFQTVEECAFACKDVRIGSRMSRWFTFGGYTDDSAFSPGCDSDKKQMCHCYCETVDECTEKERHGFRLYMYTPHPKGKC